MNTTNDQFQRQGKTPAVMPIKLFASRYLAMFVVGFLFLRMATINIKGDQYFKQFSLPVLDKHKQLHRHYVYSVTAMIL